MDIKDLNRSQFLLLLLLIMLVTSITTAVVTVTLFDQTPKAGIVNTVNRVIERVIPGATTTVIKIVKEAPTVSEGEQIVKATESVSPAVIKLVNKTDKGSENLGTGFIIRDGLVVTALKNIPSDLTGVNLEVVRNTTVSLAEVLSRDVDNNIVFIRFTATSTLSVGNLTLSDKSPTNGQTSVALSYSDSGNPDIMIGLIMGLINATSSTTPNQSVDLIRTGSVIGDNIGGPVVGLDGKVIGIGISRGYALAAPALKALVDQIK
ncbi:MAG: trypsin-like peptidase domain-containing protein [Candidatus Paceibacterota bacterium]|jgi:S1-C subfamily serine protease